MSKILVTGANGYIGRNVVRTLLDLGQDVTAVDLNNNLVDPRAKKLDLNVLEDNNYTFESLGEPEICIHLAWRDGFVHNSPNHIKYLPNHYDFINKLVEGGLKQAVVMGSMHEVGYYEGAVDENIANNPSSLYGVAKNALRQSLEILSQNKDFILQWIRGFYIYGDDRYNHSIFTKILQKYDAGEKTFPLNSGKNKYDFIKIDDLALEIALVARQQDVSGIINCCTGKPVSLKDKVEEFVQENSLDINFNYGAFPDRVYDSPIIYGNSEKINKILKSAQGKVNDEYNQKITNLLAIIEG